MSRQHGRGSADGGDVPLSFLEQRQQSGHSRVLCESLGAFEPSGQDNHVEISRFHIIYGHVWYELNASAPLDGSGGSASFNASDSHRNPRTAQDVHDCHGLDFLKPMRERYDYPFHPHRSSRPLWTIERDSEPICLSSQ